MIALDTNVLARAFADDDPSQSPSAQEALRMLTEDEPGFVSLTVLVEMHWVLRRTIGLSAARVQAIYDAMLAVPALEVEDGESVGEALEQTRQGADFADALIQATHRLYGITETVTFDQDAARRFGWRLLA